MRWEIFMVMKVQVVIFCVMTPSNNVVGYLHFKWLCCLYLQGEVNSAMEGTLILGGSIRGSLWMPTLLEEQAKSRVHCSLIGTGLDGAPCRDLQGEPYYTELEKSVTRIISQEN
jgi:hypothetical protein